VDIGVLLPRSDLTVSIYIKRSALVLAAVHGSQSLPRLALQESLGLACRPHEAEQHVAFMPASRISVACSFSMNRVTAVR
jgi:hypothetical protein